MYVAALIRYEPTGRTEMRRVEVSRLRERHGDGSGKWIEDRGQSSMRQHREYIPVVIGPWEQVDDYDVAVGRYRDMSPVWSEKELKVVEPKAFRLATAYECGIVRLASRLGVSAAEIEDCFSAHEIETAGLE